VYNNEAYFITLFLFKHLILDPSYDLRFFAHHPSLFIVLTKHSVFCTHSCEYLMHFVAVLILIFRCCILDARGTKTSRERITHIIVHVALRFRANSIFFSTTKEISVTLYYTHVSMLSSHAVGVSLEISLRALESLQAGC
jgi:hypothetical protein